MTYAERTKWDGESKDQIRIWTYVEQSAVCTGWDVKAAAKLRRVRDADESQKHKYLVPHEGVLARSQAMTALSLAYNLTGVNRPSFLATWPPVL